MPYVWHEQSLLHNVRRAYIKRIIGTAESRMLHCEPCPRKIQATFGHNRLTSWRFWRKQAEKESRQSGEIHVTIYIVTVTGTLAGIVVIRTYSSGSSDGQSFKMRSFATTSSER